MKTASVYVSLLCVLALTAYGRQDGLRFDDLDGSVIREGASAVMPELHGSAFNDVLASGVTPLYDEAVLAEGDVTDPNGSVTKSHMTFVPFVNSTTRKRGYYMRVSVSSIDDVPLFDQEFTVHDVECNCLSDSAAALNNSQALRMQPQSILSDAKKIRDWIKVKNWASIKSWISGQLAKGVAKAIINEIVKKGFELAGYKCPNLPWYIPAKFLVYMLSCYRVAY